MSDPLFSVIIPVRDAGAGFEKVLDALGSSTFAEYEVIVVDDGSCDGSAEVARRFGARVIESDEPRGPAVARNLGAAAASGRYLFFIDADCVVHDDTLALAAQVVAREPETDALFGSYDDHPPGRGFSARYKNLFHAYTHRRGPSEATTFWAGCGVVRKAAFDAVGGFDGERFPRPSIEDVELGYRLRDHGFRIRLHAHIRVTHLKEWTFFGMIRSDILDRGVPWTLLMLENARIETSLNWRWSERVSGVLVWLLLLGLVATGFSARGIWLSAGAALLLLGLNGRLYRFFFERCGPWFAIRAIPVHWFYYLYGTMAIMLGIAKHVVRKPSWLAPVLLMLAPVLGGDVAAQQPKTCTVAYIVDGDEFHCRTGEKIRLLLIDAPDGGRFGAIARKALAALLPIGREVRYETDRVARDGDNRVLAYVFLEDGRMVNELLLREGYAFLEPSVDNRRFVGRLRGAETEARERGHGVWSQ